MISIPRDIPATDAAEDFAGSRDDFGRALRSLGAGIEADQCDGVSPHGRRVLLGCSYEAWVHAVGRVPVIADHFGPGGHIAFQIWEYRCIDGSVFCVGRTYRGGNGRQSVWIRAVYSH